MNIDTPTGRLTKKQPIALPWRHPCSTWCSCRFSKQPRDSRLLCPWSLCPVQSLEVRGGCSHPKRPGKWLTGIDLVSCSAELHWNSKQLKSCSHPLRCSWMVVLLGPQRPYSPGTMPKTKNCPRQVCELSAFQVQSWSPARPLAISARLSTSDVDRHVARRVFYSSGYSMFPTSSRNPQDTWEDQLAQLGPCRLLGFPMFELQGPRVFLNTVHPAKLGLQLLLELAM